MMPVEAADLAARTLAAIDADLWNTESVRAADRERVASDLAGLRRCYPSFDGLAKDLQPIFAAGLRRTAALYGVTP